MITRLKSKLDSHGKEILSKSLVTFILKIAGAGLAFLFQLIIARQLGADGAGIYFLVLNILLILAIATRLGMDNSVTRFVAAHASISEWNQVKGVTRTALQIALLVSIMTSLVFYSFSGLITTLFSKPELQEPLELMILLTAPLSLMTLYAKAIQGLKMAKETMLMQSVLPNLFACGLALYLTPILGISGAVAAYGIGITITLLYGIFTWHKKISSYSTTIAAFNKKILLGTSLPLLGAVLLQQISISLPLIALGFFAPSSEVGIFGAAQRTAGLVSLVLVATNVIVAPKLAELYQKQDMAALGRVARQGSLIMTVMASPVLFLCILFPEWMMSLFGQEFASGWLLLVIMALGQLVNVMTGSVGFLLIMTGNEKSFLWANLISAVLCTCLAITLIPYCGAIGAALAAAIPLAVVNLIRVHTIWEKLKIMPIPFLSKFIRHNIYK